MKKIYILLFVVFLSSIINTSYSQCLQGWTYSSPITITNSNPVPLVNFQVRIIINTGALVSAGHMQASGNDIRFTQGNCCNFLPHTIESGMNTSTTAIWIRVDSVPAGGNAIIELNYGNSSAISVDNAVATFDMWEPFDAPMNHFSPTCGGGTYNVALGNGDLTWSSNYMIASDITFDMDTIYTVEGNVNSAAGNWPGINFSKVAPDYKGYSMLLSGLQPRMGEAGTSASDFCRGENWASGILSASSVVGIWSVTWISTGNIIGSFPTIGAMSSTSTTHARDNHMKVCIGGISSGSGSMNLDWVRVRKYAASVPGFSVGSETPLSFQIVSLGADTNVCDITSGLTLDAGSGFSSYTWAGVASGSSQTAMVNTIGMVIINAMDASSCPSSDTLLVSEFPPVNVNVGVDQTICPEDTTALDAGSGFTGYVWSSGGNAQVENISSAGSYTVTVTDANGCTGADTVIVSEFSPASVDLGPDQFICLGDSAALDAGSGFSAYSWSSGGSAQIESVGSAGSYIVNVTDGNSCTDSDSIVVSLFPQPVSSFTFSSVSLSTSFTNTSTGGSTYFWDFGDGNTSTDFDTVHVFSASGTYNVCLTVTSADNCETTTCTSVIVTNTGLNNELSSAGINVYPNPAKDNVWINSSISHDEVNIFITDMLGKVIFKRSFKNFTGQSIDLSTFNSGNYIIQIIIDGRYYHTPLIVSE